MPWTSRDFDREDVYLMAILKSSALGKANVIPWLEMDTPRCSEAPCAAAPVSF